MAMTEVTESYVYTTSLKTRRCAGRENRHTSMIFSQQIIQLRERLLQEPQLLRQLLLLQP